MTKTIGPAPAAVPRPRHYRLAFSFAVVVLVPTIAMTLYLWGLARDQYISTMSLTVRTEDTQSAIDMLGGLSNISGSSSSDIDVLQQYIQSSDLVSQARLVPRFEEAFSRGWPYDFLYAYEPGGTIEDYHNFWNSAVTTSTEAGLLTVKVRSYDPQTSYEISQFIYDQSKSLINNLSAEAREDATSFTRRELDRAEDRLSAARQDLTTYRLRNQIVDPSATLAAQMGILTNLQTELANALVQRSLLEKTSSQTDPRSAEVNRRIDALTAQIEQEQEKFGSGGVGPGGEDYANLFADYEKLFTEQTFAEESYRAAMVAHDSALAKAQMRSRYLAIHVQPTRAEKSMFPDRPITLMVLIVFVTLAWAVGLLVYYSIRDRQ